MKLFPGRCILISVAFALSVSILVSSAGLSQEDGYDGLWFLGFNMKKDIFNGTKGKLLRQAFNYAIDRRYICKNIIGDDNIPTGVIPMGMPGSNTDIEGYSYSPAEAVKLLRQAGYSRRDKRLNGLLLIHTNGTKTVQIAQLIKKDLSSVGIEVKLKNIDYEEEDSWENELMEKKEHLFLMGYKSSMQPFENKNDDISRTEQFLRDLFYSSGEANMGSLKNKGLDAIIDTISATASSEPELKLKLLEKANRVMTNDPVTVNLFYIKEL